MFANSIPEALFSNKVRTAAHAVGFTAVIFLMWLFHVICSQAYYTLEITAPPSPYGVPTLLRCDGPKREVQFPESMQPQLQGDAYFLYRYSLIAIPIDQVRLLSFLPEPSVGRAKATLYDPEGQILKQWNAKSIAPMTLAQSKQCISFEFITDNMMALSSQLDTEAFKNPSPASIPKSMLLLVLAPFLFYFLLTALEMKMPLFSKVYENVLLLPFPLGRSLSTGRLWLSCFIAIIGLSLLTWSICGIHYITADDPLMALIAKGYLTNKPDFHLVFMNACLGLVFQWLYTLNSGIPWYQLTLISLNIVGLSTILFCVLTLSNSFLRLLLFLFLFVSCGFFLIVYFQFTMVAFVVGISGFLLYVTSAMSGNLTKTRIFTSLALIVLGASVRIHPACLLTALTLPLLLYTAWTSQTKLKCSAFILLVLGAMAFLFFSDRYLYLGDPAWKDYYNYNWVHGSLYETPAMKSYLDRPDLYKHIGWSRNDFEMFNSASIQDERVFSFEHINYLFTHLRPPPKVNPFWALVAYLLQYPHLTCLWLMWILTATSTGLLRPRLLATILLPYLFIVVFLIMTARLPERVLVPMFFLQFSLLLLLSKFPSRINPVMPAGTILFFIFFINAQVFAYSLLLFKDGINFNQRREVSTEASMAELSTHGPLTIINCVAGIAIEQTSPWLNFKEINKLNIFELDWSFPGPEYGSRLRFLDMTNPFVDLVIHKDHFLAISVWDLRKLVYIERFLEEHYGIHVEFTVAKIPGTDKDATFPFFTLFQAHEVASSLKK